MNRQSGYWMIVHTTTGEIVTRGQSIYSSEHSAKCGLTTWVRDKSQRANYAIIEITSEDVLRLYDEKSY